MWKLLVVVVLAAPPDYGLSTGGPPTPPPTRPPPRPPKPNVCLPREPDRSCTTDADCAIVRRVVDCCGSDVVTGINRNDLTAHQEYLKACGMRRSCGCMAAPTRLDDGSSQDRLGQVVATCRENVCTTSMVREEVCSPQECGPAPTYPTSMCPDGVNRSGRGPCARVDGVCRWTRLECPR